MVELIHKRHSEKDGHAMDVLIEALRKQRVQAHIARELQRALARAKDQKKGKVAVTFLVYIHVQAAVYWSFPGVVSDGMDASPLSTPSTTTPASETYTRVCV